MTKTVDNGTLADYNVATGAGAVDADTQRVTLASDDPAVVKLGTIDADTGNIATSVATIAGAVSGTEVQVDIASVVGTSSNEAGQATISNTSATIVASGSGRRGVLVVNQQTVPVYIDPSGGTATTSMFRLDPGAAVVLPVTTAVTGIASAAYTPSGDAKVHWMTFA